MRAIVGGCFQRTVFQHEGGDAVGGQRERHFGPFGLHRQIPKTSTGGDDDGGAGRRTRFGLKDLQRRSGDVSYDFNRTTGEFADHFGLTGLLRPGRDAWPHIEGLSLDRGAERSGDKDREAEMSEDGRHQDRSLSAAEGHGARPFQTAYRVAKLTPGHLVMQSLKYLLTAYLK
ncbi:hypothetical protein BREVUG8_110026 [Brevundimonas sp. G8]|nr:hypothetical protein BREVUG8_110026 [Brevundimonas sp. G8]